MFIKGLFHGPMGKNFWDCLNPEDEWHMFKGL